MNPFGDVLKLFDGMADAVGTYSHRKLARTAVDDLIVSTCWTKDCGWETAILHMEGTHPVERYQSKEQAQVGHEKWCRDIVGAKEITELGYGETIKPQTKSLVRFDQEILAEMMKK